MKRSTSVGTFALALIMVAGLPATSRATWVLEYDSQTDETVIGGTTDLYPWGEANGQGCSACARSQCNHKRVHEQPGETLTTKHIPAPPPPARSTNRRGKPTRQTGIELHLGRLCP